MRNPGTNVAHFARVMLKGSRAGITFAEACEAATRNRTAGMSAEEFARRMAGYDAQARELQGKMAMQDHVVYPFMQTWSAARQAGCRITRWHITPEVHAQLQSMGMAGDMILGYPVVVDR